MRLAIAQINATVGAIDANAAKILDYARQADRAGADLVLFPELAVCGYPPEDLVLRDDFQRACDRALASLAAGYDGEAIMLVGAPRRAEGALGVHNSLAVIRRGEVIAQAALKQQLPNYGVFDERRVFIAGADSAYLTVGEHRIGLTICEDLWVPGGPAHTLAAAGATLILNASASPYYAGKLQIRRELLATRAREHGVAVGYCNMVAGQDEMIFDGGSMIYDHTGRLIAAAAQFDEQLLIADIDLDVTAAARRADVRLTGVAPLGAARELLAAPAARRPRPKVTVKVAQPLPREQELYEALTLALRDYHNKNGFRGVTIGLSGGVDSALVAAIATDALGPERVTCISMPSRFSSPATQNDARDMAAGLGVRFAEIPIGEMMNAYDRALDGHLPDPSEGDVTFENVQARIRGNLLMAVSNREGTLVVTTANKSESAVGYSTLYGDMAGGFALIKDLPKLDVFALCRWRNTRGAVIPPSILDRPPSAELSDGQQDTDSLPPYEILDPILEGFVEQDASEQQLIDAGFDPATVRRVCWLVDRAEYKRRQAAPGPKVTTRAFGRDRRVPITSAFASQRAATVEGAEAGA